MRSASRNRWVWIGLTAMQPDFPLTRFLADLNEATALRVRAMPIDKTAKHYGFKRVYVQGYRDMVLGVKQ